MIVQTGHLETTINATYVINIVQYAMGAQTINALVAIVGIIWMVIHAQRHVDNRS